MGIRWINPSYILFFYPSNSHCNRGYDVENTRRIIVHFDLSAIPLGSKIIEAILQLHVYTPKDTIPVRVYGLTECFKEEEVSWMNREEANAWKKKGGTHELKVIDMGTLGKFRREVGFYRFNVTDYYVRVFNGEIDNCGILITPDVKSESSVEFVGTCGLEGECQELYRNNFRQYLIDRTEEHYAKFFSRELAQKNDELEYSPKLMIKFVGPYVSLKSDVSSLELVQGEDSTFNVKVEGTFKGKVDISSEIGGEGITLEGIKPVDVGSTIPLSLRVSEDAPPGSYFIKLQSISKGI